MLCDLMGYRNTDLAPDGARRDCSGAAGHFRHTVKYKLLKARLGEQLLSAFVGNSRQPVARQQAVLLPSTAQVLPNAAECCRVLLGNHSAAFGSTWAAEQPVAEQPVAESCPHKLLV